MAALFSSCDNDDPVPEPDFSRTVLVYMVADNSLGSVFGSDADNLSQMETAVMRGALDGGGRLLVYHDGSSTPPQLLDMTTSGRVVLREYDESVSSLDPERMHQVIDDARAVAPADDYGLVLWSHGTGWIESSSSRSVEASPQSFGQDKTPSTVEMKISTLADALSGAGGGFSFIYFDCCFMATVEVAYELRRCTDAIIAHATELPVEGMPYTVNIPEMFRHDINLEMIARNTRDYYMSSSASNNSCAISLIDTSKLDALADATKAIMATGAVAAYDYNPVRFFRSGGANSHTYDMGDYINALDVDASLLEVWNAAYRAVVPYYGSTPVSYTLDMSRFTGLGCYIVRSSSDASLLGYRNQSWWTDVVSHNPSLK